ncbi:hypothetical protein LRS73_17670 [Methylobacterium currus]|uniref:hypothetical protein n=1 Tax=Methylobacterium currus TaxID=2051553 RepID=UPI001E5AC349|nr:hypothetical protein [Methylobacterium currus]UHC14387.1 hypothetical protein LRS73_17670 [Methylobacterium currus]
MDDAIATVFAPLIGLPCWGVARGQGSILSFEFGAPRLFVREPFVSSSSSPKVRDLAARRVVRPVGAWNLFVFCCHWRVVASGEALADDDSPPAQIDAAARAMDGQSLTAFTLGAASRQAVFAFDLGARLTAWPCASNGEEQWSLYLPDERVLTYRADSCASLGAADDKLEQAVWQAVAWSVGIP